MSGWGSTCWRGFISGNSGFVAVVAVSLAVAAFVVVAIGRFLGNRELVERRDELRFKHLLLLLGVQGGRSSASVSGTVTEGRDSGGRRGSRMDWRVKLQTRSAGS
jgi:hypothetical protein